MREGFPKALVRFLVGVGPGLWLTTGLAACVALASGLLAFHYKREAYGGGEEVLFRACLIVSTGILLCSGIYACAIAIFGESKLYSGASVRLDPDPPLRGFCQSPLQPYGALLLAVRIELRCSRRVRRPV